MSKHEQEVMTAELKEDLYNTVYRSVNDRYDLRQPMLARLVRGCVDNWGEVPASPDRDAVVERCPQILKAIEQAYYLDTEYKRIQGILPLPRFTGQD